MEQTKILHADYLDILFDQRNKKYGSYELRKHYDQRVRKAALFIALGVSAFVGLAFITADRGGGIRPHVVVTAPSIVDIKPMIKPELKVMKEVAPPPAAKQVKTKLFTDPVIDLTDHVPDDKLMTQNKDLKDAHTGLTTQTGDTVDIVSTTPKKNTVIGTITTTENNAPKIWVSQMPQFVGDMEAYIAAHLNYPEMARSINIEGTVMVQFVVNEDGSVSNTKVVRGIGGGCDDEAQKMVKGMPHWKPGKQNGTPVKVFFTLPIKFLLK
ncbi:MAG: energy transducer TonB [Flavipsychrobacter sp.]|nr:energy transducer TonB [Flavipsychrobacter sp.]